MKIALSFDLLSVHRRDESAGNLTGRSDSGYNERNSQQDGDAARRGGYYIDRIYYCPRHPHKGYEGEIPELKFDCGCRKPKSGMLLKAAKDFNINLENSRMIGVGENDIRAEKNAGCKTCLIGKGAFG